MGAAAFLLVALVQAQAAPPAAAPEQQPPAPVPQTEGQPQPAPEPPPSSQDFDLLTPQKAPDEATVARQQEMTRLLSRRRTMLQLHQLGGYATLATVTAAVVLGQINYLDKYAGGGDTGRWITPPRLPTDRTALLVQENIPILQAADWTKDYFEGTLRDLTWISLNPPGSSETQHVDPIIWPESPAPFYSGDPDFRQAVSNLAREAHAWVITGSIGVRNASQSPERETHVYNSAALISPSGDWVSRYDKVHLVPFGEYVPFKNVLPFMDMLTKEVGDFQRGRSRAPLEADGSKIGVFICYESIFPDEVRQFVANGAQVLVNISNDGWYGDSGAYAQHLSQTRMRAIENGRWLLSDTNTGVTASIDPYGRIVARAERKVRTVLEAPYALTSVTTFYTRHGDWFAYLCAIIFVGARLTRFTFQRKAK